MQLQCIDSFTPNTAQNSKRQNFQITQQKQIEFRGCKIATDTKNKKG